MIAYSEFKPEYAPLYGEYDVVVVGGGMAGVGAAVASARGGAKTILIENTSALGGLATMGIVNIPLDFPSGLGQELHGLEGVSADVYECGDVGMGLDILDDVADVIAGELGEHLGGDEVLG